jgi:multimeric flavodoxin WrbA
MKALIDRCGYVARAYGQPFRGRLALLSALCGGREPCMRWDSMNHFFLINNMIVPGSTYFSLGMGRKKEEVLPGQ